MLYVVPWSVPFFVHLQCHLKLRCNLNVQASINNQSLSKDHLKLGKTSIHYLPRYRLHRFDKISKLINRSESVCFCQCRYCTYQLISLSEFPVILGWSVKRKDTWFQMNSGLKIVADVVRVRLLAVAVHVTTTQLGVILKLIWSKWSQSFLLYNKAFFKIDSGLKTTLFVSLKNLKLMK